MRTPFASSPIEMGCQELYEFLSHKGIWKKNYWSLMLPSSFVYDTHLFHWALRTWNWCQVGGCKSAFLHRPNRAMPVYSNWGVALLSLLWGSGHPIYLHLGNWLQHWYKTGSRETTWTPTQGYLSLIWCRISPERIRGKILSSEVSCMQLILA